MALHETHRQWIEARGLSVELAEKLGLDTVKREGSAWLSVPYVLNGEVVNHKYRRTSVKDHRMDKGAKKPLWNHDCLLTDCDKPVVITEGEWDAMAALSLGWRAVSVPNGASGAGEGSGAYEYLWEAKDAINRNKQFILATDGDSAGLALRADLVALLGADRCSFVEYPLGIKHEPLKDLNEVLVAYGIEGVSQVLKAAKPVPVTGLYRLADFPAPPTLASIGCGIEGLGELFRLTPGTFSVISGWAGHGKTSLLMAILGGLMKQGVSIAVGSFETLPRPILERRLRAAIYGCKEYAPEAMRPGAADEMMAQRLSVIAHSPTDDDTDLDLETVLDLMRVAVQRDGVRLIVLDPWNEIEHKRGRDETETEYVSRAIRMLKRFAKNHECAVWLVAHPRKPHTDGNPKPPSLYDLAGSAHFANKADYGLIIHRDDLTSNTIDARVVKVRMGLPGKIGRVSLDFDESTSSYAKTRWAA